MEELRKSLWSRLVVFYSVNKRDQLNPEVMAEIVAKYGSKEKELSARLLKKYRRPLPPSVPAQDLRRVLLEFGMEDQDVATAAAAAAAVGRTSDERARRNPAGAARLEGQAGQGEGQAKRPPRGGELNFRSKFFDPLQALNHETLRPPFPRERALDNLAKFARMMPKRAAAAGTATAGGAVAGADANVLSPTSSTPKNPAVAAGSVATSSASHGTPQPGVAGKSARDPAAARGRSSPAAPEPAATQGGPIRKPSAGNPVGGAVAAGGGGMRRRGPGESGVGGSIGGHYGPPVGSAEELDRIDKDMASKRRNAELLLAGGAAGPAVPDEERFNPVQRIMREYAGKGPYSLLYRLHEDKRRASVMIRRVNSIRGTCTGLIRAFDRHMNLLLVDVQEDYTAFVPDRDPKPKRQERRPQGAPSPNPLQGGGMGVEEEGDGLRGKPAEVRDTGSARGLSAGVGGEDGEGGWGTAGSLRWSGGGSVSWGGGGGGVEEVVRLSRPHGTAADGRKSAFGAEELDAGGGGGGDAFRGVVGGDRGAVAPAADSSGARVESVTVESAGARDEVASSHVGETQLFAETTGGLGSGQPLGAFLSEEGKVGDRGQGARRVIRIGEVQPPPPGEEGSSDSNRVGGQGQHGSFGQPPVEGRGSGLQDDGASGATDVKKKSNRRSRGRGPWTGKLVPVRRRRFLKQLMIRGDNVVMVWESSKR